MNRRVSAILLAAGASRRMGRPKALLPIGDRLSVVRCVEALRHAGVAEVVVVVAAGATGGAVARAVTPLGRQWWQTPTRRATWRGRSALRSATILSSPPEQSRPSVLSTPNTPTRSSSPCTKAARGTPLCSHGRS